MSDNTIEYKEAFRGMRHLLAEKYPVESQKWINATPAEVAGKVVSLLINKQKTKPDKLKWLYKLIAEYKDIDININTHAEEDDYYIVITVLEPQGSHGGCYMVDGKHMGGMLNLLTHALATYIQHHEIDA